MRLSYFMIVLAFALGCRGWGSSDAAARSALNVLTDVVSPASKLASQGCDAQEALQLSRAKSGATTAASAEERIRETRQRCDVLNEAFATIRKLHGEAARFVEDGKVEDAQRCIDAARA